MIPTCFQVPGGGLESKKKDTPDFIRGEAEAGGVRGGGGVFFKTCSPLSVLTPKSEGSLERNASLFLQKTTFLKSAVGASPGTCNA